MTVTAIRPTMSNNKIKIIPIRKDLDELKEEQFIITRQGEIINDLLKIAPKKDSYRKDKFADKESFKNGAVNLEIHKVTDITSSFNTPTKQLLDILIIYHNKQGCNGCISVQLDEFMTIRGLNDKKSARKKVNEIIKLLCNSFITSTTFVIQKNKKTNKLEKVEKTYKDIPLLEYGYIKNSFITVKFSEQFSEIISNSQIMPYPLELLKINGKKNPNSFNFLRKIAEHKNMNIGKTNENIISVNKLLEYSDTISTLEEVRATNRHINKHIIVPLERDLDSLSSVLSWSYQKRGGIPISEEELNSLKYDDRLRLSIKINWHCYPDQTDRINKKKEKKSNSKVK